MTSAEESIKDFEKKFEQSFPHRYISPKNKNKLLAFETLCKKIKNYTQEISQTSDIYETMAQKLEYLNSLSPELGNQITDNALTNFKENEFNIMDLDALIEFSYNNAKNTDKANENYVNNLNDLVHLPLTLSIFVKKEPNNLANFLKYVKTANNQPDLKSLKEKYEEFAEIVIQGIFTSEKYSEILAIKLLGASWEEIRKFFKERNDAEGINWVNKFEDLQNRYQHVNLCDVARRYQ